MIPSKEAVAAAFGKLCMYNVAMRQLEAAYDIDVVPLEKKIEKLEKENNQHIADVESCYLLQKKQREKIEELEVINEKLADKAWKYDNLL